METKNNGYSNDFDISGGEFTIPLNFSIGCEYQLTEIFAVALEYQTRPFESYKLNADRVSPEEDSDIAELESFIKAMNLKNGHVFHAGIEISLGNVPFRFGFFIEPYPLISEEIKSGIEKLSEKPTNMIGGTFGFSAPVSKNVFLELAGQYRLLKSTIVESNLSSPSSGLKEYEEKRHHLRINLGFRADLPSFSSNQSTNTDISATVL